MGDPVPTPTDWDALWAKAGQQTAVESSFEGVYTGPAWESGPPLGGSAVRVWKLAILRRQPSGGAEHWGHLFIVQGQGASGVVIRSEGGLQGDRDRPLTETLPRMSGVPLEIRIRPRSVDSAPQLRAFAEAFQRHAASLLPPWVT